MKILYSIQATGNGHISRAMELLPFFEKYGQVDLFLSGSNSTLELNAPIAFRSKGVSLHYTCDGSLNYPKTILNISLKRIWKEAKDLPVEKYDLVLNDFEAITSLSCKKKQVPMLHFGHQASFVSLNTPRPTNKSIIGEWILKNYAKSNNNVGIHFDRYADFIQPPVIKQEIWDADPTDKGYITVYLPSFCDKELIDIFSKLSNISFEIFSRQAKNRLKEKNITIFPVDKLTFNESLIHCHGIITGAGFETPAEALYLNKKLFAIPIAGQYEQSCNAAALEKLGIKTVPRITDNFGKEVEEWLNSTQPNNPISFKPTQEIIDTVMAKAATMSNFREEKLISSNPILCFP